MSVSQTITDAAKGVTDSLNTHAKYYQDGKKVQSIKPTTWLPGWFTVSLFVATFVGGFTFGYKWRRQQELKEKAELQRKLQENGIIITATSPNY